MAITAVTPPTVRMEILNATTTGALVVRYTVTDGTDTITETVITEEFAGLAPEQIDAKFSAEIAPMYLQRWEAYQQAKTLVGQTFST